MIMSRQASQLAGDAGTVVSDPSRHRPFTVGGQAPGADEAPPAPVAGSGASGGVPPLRCLRCRASQLDSRTEPACVEGTTR